MIDLSRGDAWILAAVVFLAHNRHSRRGRSHRVRRLQPARFISLPSIAYRLARVAAGDGVAAVSLGGHLAASTMRPVMRLLRGAGGMLLNENGARGDVRPGRHEPCQAAVSVARPTPPASWPCEPVLVCAQRDGEPVAARQPHRSGRRSFDDDAVLDRAQGCLFGQVIGDNLGGLVESQDREAISHRYPGGCSRPQRRRALEHSRGPGDGRQRARARPRAHAHRDEALRPGGRRRRLRRLVRLPPFDYGNTIAQALSAVAIAGAGCKAEAASSQADACSQANGSLMRISPVGIWAREPAIADRVAREDSRLTHPNEICVDACGVFAAAIAEGVKSGDRNEMLRVALAYATTRPVNDVLGRAVRGEAPERYSGGKSGWVLIALQNAFFNCSGARASRMRWWRPWARAAIPTPTPPSPARCWGLPMDWARSRPAGSCRYRPAGPTTLWAPSDPDR